MPKKEKVELSTDELLSELDKQMDLLNQIENTPEYIKRSKQSKVCDELKAQIKEKIKNGEEITGTAKYEIYKQRKSSWDVSAVVLKIWSLSSVYLWNPKTEITYPEADLKRMEQDIADWVLPASLLDAKKPTGYAVYIQPRKQKNFILS